VRDGDAYVLASDGHGSINRAHTLAAGPAAARAAGVSPLRVEQLTRANPRFLLRDGIPREPRADVTNGSGGTWERLDDGWSDPYRVVARTIDSNR
jgi:hypothetical protein